MSEGRQHSYCRSCLPERKHKRYAKQSGVATASAKTGKRKKALAQRRLAYGPANENKRIPGFSCNGAAAAISAKAALNSGCCVAALKSGMAAALSIPA